MLKTTETFTQLSCWVNVIVSLDLCVKPFCTNQWDDCKEKEGSPCWQWWFKSRDGGDKLNKSLWPRGWPSFSDPDPPWRSEEAGSLFGLVIHANDLRVEQRARFQVSSVTQPTHCSWTLTDRLPENMCVGMCGRSVVINREADRNTGLTTLRCLFSFLISTSSCEVPSCFLLLSWYVNWGHSQFKPCVRSGFEW